MLRELRKIWLDTTTFEERYVAKDVRNAVAFLAGTGLIIASGLGGYFNKTIDLAAGTTLLAYSLGGDTVKQFFKYKNNTVVPDAAGPPEDNDTPDVTPKS